MDPNIADDRPTSSVENEQTAGSAARCEIGYSLGDLAPAIPANLAVAYQTGVSNTLSWDQAADPDFQYYRIYCSSDPDFDGVSVHYEITSTDFSGNESSPASPQSVTEVPGAATSKTFVLHQNEPNPFNPRTTIQYSVSTGGGHVTLRILDLRGRWIRRRAR